MAIHIDILARVQEREARKAANQLADQFEDAGVRAGERFGDEVARGLAKSSPKVQKALEGVVGAQNAAKAAKSSYQAISREVEAADKREADAANAVANARRNVENAALATIKAEYSLSQYQKRRVKDTEKEAILIEEVAAAKRREENASNAVTAATTAESAAKRATIALTDRQTAAANSYSSAVGRVGMANRSAAESIRKYNDEVKDANSKSTQLTNALKGLGTQAFLVTRGLGVMIAPAAIQFLIETADVAVTASQSLLLLPAAAAAAGAGIGTLTLATQGFSDAITNVRDIDKFSESLAKLAPNAQQAALAIRAALPMFDQIQQSAQNALFAGTAGRVTQFSTILGPQIQAMTTSIATSMNRMLTDVFDLLLSNTGSQQVSTIMDNISAAFTNAAPAAQSFTNAMLKLTEVGSTFLPQLGDGISSVADDFNNWINEAANNGDLQRWIDEGIIAMKGLGTAVQNVGSFMYDTFGGATQEEVDLWNQKLQNVLTTLNLIVEALKLTQQEIPLVGQSFDQLFTKFADPLAAMGRIIDGFKELGLIGDGPSPEEKLRQQATDKMNADRVKRGLPPLPGGTPSAGTVVDKNAKPGSGSGGGLFDKPPSLSGLGQGAQWRLDQPVIGDWTGKPVLTPELKTPSAGSPGSKPTEAEIREGIIAGLNPADWRVDPFAGMPGGAPPIGANGQVMPGMIAPTADPQDVLEGQRDVIAAAHDLEEDRKQRLALEKDNNATAADIEKAKWDELQGTWKLQESQAKLIDKMKGTASKAKTATDQLGVALDPDLGLSNGLAGFADNLTRIVGNMITEPLRKELGAIVDADPIKGGFGLLGIMGAKNIAAGKSPLLGRDMPTDSSATTGPAGYSAPGAPTMVTAPSVGGAQPGESARSFAHRQMMPYFQAQGLEVGDHAADKYGEHQNGALDIMVDSIDQGNKVLAQVLADPNVKGAIFNNQVYGYGQGASPRPYSGGNTGDPSQDHTNHVHALYDPGNPNNINPNGAPVAVGGASAGSGMDLAAMSGATPVFVVNMPGGGGMGTGGVAGLFGANGSPAPAIDAAANTFWDAIADKESSGNWANADTGKNGHYGGLQFSPSTWNQFGGQEFAPMPHQATREQQIAVADRTAFTGYNGSKPQGLGAWEVLTNGPGGTSTVPGVTASSPRPGGGAPLPDPRTLFSGGGGEGPLFPKPPPPPNVSAGQPPGGTGLPPILGAGGVASPGPLQVGPPATHGMGGGLDQIGPFPVPPTMGGIGATAGVGIGAQIGATPPMQPNVGPAPMQPPGTQIGAATASPGVAMGGNGGIGASDSTMALAGVAASALDVMAPGAGQAAQIGMKLANRAVQYGGQLAGIGVSGLMETFLPTGGSELANSGWVPRIVGGLAGAKPALPNVAGGKAGGNAPQPPLAPGQVTNGGAATPGGDKPNINVEYNNNNATEDRAGADLTHHLGQMYGG